MARKWKWLVALVLVVILVSTLVVMNPVFAGKPAPQAVPARQTANDINTDSNSYEISPGNYNIYLKITDIEGESVVQGHEKSIEALSFKWGLSQPAQVTSVRAGDASGRAQVQDLSFTHFLDKASPKLMTACAKGTHIPEVNLQLVAQEGAQALKFYEVKLSDVVISSVNLAGMGSALPAGGITPESTLYSSRPVESVTLNFGKIEWEYSLYDEHGQLRESVKGSYDVIGNKAK